jgi:cold shock protein
MATKETGKVKFPNHQKGYGFIVPDNGDKDIFLHVTQLPRDIRVEKDDKVSYEKVTTEKGLEAHNITIIK